MFCLFTVVLDDMKINYQFSSSLHLDQDLKCCGLFADGSTVLSTGPYSYQRTTDLTSLQLSRCRMIGSTIFSVSLSDGMLAALSAVVADVFSFGAGRVPVVGACVTQYIAAVTAIPSSSIVMVLGWMLNMRNGPVVRELSL